METQSAPPNRLRVLRAEKRVNQHEVAKALGCSQSRYSLIENGHEAPTDDDIDKLIEYFGVSKAKIFPKVAA